MSNEQVITNAPRVRGFIDAVLAAVKIVGGIVGNSGSHIASEQAVANVLVHIESH